MQIDRLLPYPLRNFRNGREAFFESPYVQAGAADNNGQTPGSKGSSYLAEGEATP